MALPRGCRAGGDRSPLTPLSSLWIHGDARERWLAARSRRAAEQVVVRDDSSALMPQRLLGVRQSIDAAARQGQQQPGETADRRGVIQGPRLGRRDGLRGRRSIEVDALAVFRAVTRVGGANGWYAADWLWRVRGVMDRLVGGPGLRRGRRHPETLAYGDALDFWRVIGIERDRSLDLRAEMRLPGVARLTFTIEPRAGRPRACRLVRSVPPRGPAGIVYWYSVLPLHGIVFRGMPGAASGPPRRRPAMLRLTSGRPRATNTITQPGSGDACMRSVLSLSAIFGRSRLAAGARRTAKGRRPRGATGRALGRRRPSLRHPRRRVYEPADMSPLGAWATRGSAACRASDELPVGYPLPTPIAASNSAVPAVRAPRSTGRALRIWGRTSRSGRCSGTTVAASR